MMKTKWKNNSLITYAFAAEQVKFDIGTDKCSLQFNGRGGFNFYHLVDEPKYSVGGPSFLDIFINDKAIGVHVKKIVKNVGRLQRITYKFDDGKIVINQFAFEEYIFNKISYSFKSDKNIVFAYEFLKFVNMPTLVADSNFEHHLGNDKYYVFRSGKKGSANVCISFTSDPNKMIRKTNRIYKQIVDEFSNLPIPESCSSDLEKTIYTSSMFTALENYKNKGDFKAFAAGVNYLTPLRTYFRDSYWTTLCLYGYKSELIKNQILVLAKGIRDDGDCPSAVKSDFTGFWGGHIDSPCFFTMMVADYVKNTKDKSILDIKVNDITIKDLCVKVVDKIMSKADKSHLIYKAGPFNRLDWADAVNRTGYVTYDECLYYQCLICLDYILESEDKKYINEAKLVKDAINNILWDNDKNYYVNFVDENNKEDNLSIDTILTVLFGIVPEDKKEILIDNFESILYSKNHKDIDDFGVMCLYPLYKGYSRAMSYSSHPYRYHNGGNWPYWTGMFVYMLMINNRDYKYALESWFTYSVKQGCLTPLEYISPYFEQGSDLQAWSSTFAFALQQFGNNFFKYNKQRSVML